MNNVTEKMQNIEDITEDENDDDDGEEEDKDELSIFRDPPVGFVRMRPSHFQGLPSTVFIEYPPELGVHRIDMNVLEPIGKRKLIYKSYWERVCIKNAFMRAGFIKTESVSSVQWTAMFSKHQNVSQMKDLNCLQKINHFPSSWCIGRKDRLLRTINSMRRIHGRYFDFHPEGFILPGEKDAFIRQVNNETSQVKTRNQAQNIVTKSSRRPSSAASFKTRDKVTNKPVVLEGRRPSTTTKLISQDEIQPPTSASRSPAFLWITKPVASSCGKGISVITGQQAILSISRKKKVIMQKYIDDPYLINGKKFDLRIYVLVSGVDPLRVYIHNEGLTRLSTSNYSLKNIGNKFAHLTNYSINKKADTFKAGSVDGGDGDEYDGFKWSLATFRKWLASKEGPEVMSRTMDRICDLCLKTMIAAESEITPNLHSSANYRTNCYELFGCDVMLDSHLNPHLLEVNVSPSLMGSSPLDKKIKGTLVSDIFHTVGFYPYDPALLMQFDTETKSPHYLQSDPAVGEITTNPFAFNSLSKMMASQENWRKNPSPNTIDFSTISSSDASWLLLLMAEDEFARARSTQFTRVHPQAISAAHYVGLYKNYRFSDHLLAKWIIEGGSTGYLRKYLPSRFIKISSPPKQQPTKGGENNNDSNRSTANLNGINKELNNSNSSYNSTLSPVELVSPSSQRRRQQNATGQEYSQNQSQQNIPPLYPRARNAQQEYQVPNNVPIKITPESQRTRAQSASPFRDLLRLRTDVGEATSEKVTSGGKSQGKSMSRGSSEGAEHDQLSYDKKGYDDSNSNNRNNANVSREGQYIRHQSSTLSSSGQGGGGGSRQNLDQQGYQELENYLHQNQRPTNSNDKRPNHRDRSYNSQTQLNDPNTDVSSKTQDNAPKSRRRPGSLSSGGSWSDLFEISEGLVDRDQESTTDQDASSYDNDSDLHSGSGTDKKIVTSTRENNNHVYSRRLSHTDKVTAKIYDEISNLESKRNKNIRNNFNETLNADSNLRPSASSITRTETMKYEPPDGQQDNLRRNTADTGYVYNSRANTTSGGRSNQNYRKKSDEDENNYRKIAPRSSSTTPTRPRPLGEGSNIFSNDTHSKNSGNNDHINNYNNNNVNIIDPNSYTYNKNTNKILTNPLPGMIMSNVPQHRLLPKHREFVMNTAMAGNNTINGRKRGTSAARIRKI